MTIRNYYADPRTQGPARAPVVLLDDGTEMLLPTKWAVCPVCDGKGSHVNPSIDCDGITGEEFADDPQFAEEYLDGLYDEVCNRCRGRTTVPVLDRGDCDPLLLDLYDEQQREMAECDAIQRAENGDGGVIMTIRTEAEMRKMECPYRAGGALVAVTLIMLERDDTMPKTVQATMAAGFCQGSDCPLFDPGHPTSNGTRSARCGAKGGGA